MKLTKSEKHWILYDVGNSAFIMMVSTIIPIYFNWLSENAGLSSVEYLAFWGYAASIATLIVVLVGPIAGTLADYKNLKKPIFIITVGIGTIGCAALGFISSWIGFLAVFVIAKIGFNTSIIFYDSMLPDITDSERMDEISSFGFAWGYIGSCIPFVLCLIVVLGADSFGLPMNTAMVIAFLITSVWWIASTVPLCRSYRQLHYIPRQPRPLVQSFHRLYQTFRNVKQEKPIFLFLVAFFFYIDGVYTIIEMATAYGQALGLDSTGLLLALLVTQIVAFPCSIIFGRLAKKISSERLITVCICAYICITLFALMMNRQIHFWILAVCVGMFQGGVQALSRSYYAKIIPPEKSGEYFGIFDICGKGASLLGTTLVGIVSQITGVVNAGVGSLIILFIIGLILFRKAVKTT